LTKELILTRGKVALIDDEDYWRCMQYNWTAIVSNGKWYAKRHIGGGTHQRLHNFILKTSDLLDHINGDGLDNRKSNLRKASPHQNSMNNAKTKNRTSSKYKGVHKKGSSFVASIGHNRTTLYLGSFKTEEEAAKVYDKKAKELFGEFANLNFPSVKELENV